jgi:MFS family permease
MVRGTSAGWGSLEVVGTLTLGVLLLGAFVAWERRAAEPMLALRLFRNRTFVAANASAFLTSSALFGAVFLASQYFQFVLGNSPLGTGLRFLPWTATPMFVAPLAGMMSDRIGVRPILATGLALQALGLGWFASEIGVGADYAPLVLPLIVAGVGVSMAFPTTAAGALGAVPPADIGKASGVQNTLQRFGGVFGVAIATVIFEANGHLGTAQSVNAGIGPALKVAAAMSLLGSFVALGVRARRRAGAPAAEVAVT